MLLASDVAARGLDIKGVDHVVHYQVPFTVQVRFSWITVAESATLLGPFDLQLQALHKMAQPMEMMKH